MSANQYPVMNQYPVNLRFGLLPEGEGRGASFLTSVIINLIILALSIWIGLMAKHVIQHHYEQTELIFPTKQPPQPKVHVKTPPPPKMKLLPKPAEVKLEAPRIHFEQPKPALEPVQMEAKVAMPQMREVRPAVVLAPQPKAALTAAAPAVEKQAHPSTAPVHLGDMHGVMPNANASRPATVAALGNPYGGMNGPAATPRGVVGSTGIGNGSRKGSNAGTVGRVAQTGLPGGTGTAERGGYGGHVASAGIPGMAAPARPAMKDLKPSWTSLEVLSKPPVRYTAEAREAKVQGEVVLRVTFTATGHVIVQGLVHGLGHGLDEEARREAEKIRFKPATRDGHAVDLTTNITISFQLA
ncbi:MAG TPA: energy transducer TonB [Terracidiphilus sp.]|nr:energy transducer TonB [Terracidiphilus sp.]